MNWRAAFGLVATISWGEPVAVVDGRGHLVSLDAPAQRVASLAPSTTEIVGYLAGVDRLVSVTEHCGWPPSVRSLPRLSGFDQPDYERLLALGPDLVVVSDLTSPRTVARLRGFGLKVVVLNGQGLAGVAEDLERAGVLLGATNDAQAWRQEMEATLRTLAEQPARLDGRAPRVFFGYGVGETYSAGSGTFVDGFIQAAGGVNVAAGSASPWPKLDLEYLVAVDPEVILLAAERSGPASSEQLSRYQRQPAWSRMSAIEGRRVYVVDRALVNIPGPRVLEALRQVHRALRQACANEP